MILKLLQLECTVAVNESSVTTLQIEDRKTFARVVASLESELGEAADEPYILMDEKGKRISPRKALLIIDSLPNIPLSDRTLLGKLYKRMARELEMDSERFIKVRELATELRNVFESVSDSLWGDYMATSEWEFDAYLKVFGFSPMLGESDGLLDKCMRFIDLCFDVEERRPLVLVNAKSFFSQEELDELLERAVISGIKMILVESWRDSESHPYERKVVIDQHFYVDC